MTFKYFMTNYFHQDWMVDYDDFYDAVRDFVENETTDKKEQLIADISELLSRKDLSGNIAITFGGHYAPEQDNLTAREWLKAIYKVLLE